MNIKLREGEHVLAVVQVTDDDEILLTTERGQLVRIPASEIRTVGRASKGVRIMNLNNGDRITGVAKLVKVEIEKTAVTVDGEIENKADNVLAEAAAMPEEPAVPGEDVPEQPGESEE